MTSKTRKILLIIGQIVAGGMAGIIACLVSFGLVNLFWRAVDPKSIFGFIRGILLLISFLFILSAIVASVSETVMQFKRYIPREMLSRKIVYEGCFLGICAAVALLSVTRSDWLNSLEDWGGGIKLIATLFYLLLFLPLKLVTFWIPALLILSVSAPIGATIAFYVNPRIKKKDKTGNLSEEAQTQH